MKDLYQPYMTRTPEVVFQDVNIPVLSRESLSPFADTDGAFTKGFDVALKDPSGVGEQWILSSLAKYESETDAIPTIQVRLIDTNGMTLYYSPVYEIGHRREFYRKEWRIPPTIGRFDRVRISIMIPEGVRLFLQEIRPKQSQRLRAGDYGVRYHAHAGIPGYAPNNTVPSFQATAELGFTSCITIPKFTKDGVGVCFHDDDTIRHEVCYPDGSLIEEGSPDDKPVSEFTYEELLRFDAGIPQFQDPLYAGTKVPTLEEFFRICSMTGMDPIFSVHPGLPKEQWEQVRVLLEKYRLLDRLWLKSNSLARLGTAIEVFNDSIAGYILLQGVKENWDPIEHAAELGLDPKRHRLVVEFFYIQGFENNIEDKIRNARAEGFPVSLACMRGGISGVAMQKAIDLGVSEFTLDYHCSMGLCW